VSVVYRAPPLPRLGCRTTFTEGLVCREAELSVIDISPTAIEELLSREKISELMALIDSSYEGWQRSVFIEN
jgi:hypothetical protein